MVGSTNDERCSIHNLRVERHRGFERIRPMKLFSNKSAHLSYK